MNPLKYTFIGFIALFTCAYLISNHFLYETSKELLPQLIKEQGVKIDNFDFSSAKFSSFSKMNWTDLEGDLYVEGVNGIKSDVPFNFFLDSFSVGTNSINNREFYAIAQGLVLETDTSAEDHTAQNTYISSENINAGNIVLREALYNFNIEDIRLNNPSPRNLLEQFEEPFGKLALSLKNGEVPEFLFIDGRVEFYLNETRHEVRLSVNKLTNKLELNRDDLLYACGHFDKALNFEEISFIATQPLKTPRLLQIKYEAEQTAKAMSTDNLYKDTYQYITWSYLLTKEFGTEFAKKVTDTHKKDRSGERKNEKEMDIINAEIGREYANNGVSLVSLKRTIDKDSRVIKEL